MMLHTGKAAPAVLGVDIDVGFAAPREGSAFGALLGMERLGHTEVRTRTSGFQTRSARAAQP
jgi:hypothetical protein